MLRFALPPSLPAADLVEHTRALRDAFSALITSDAVDVVVSRDYDALRQALLTGAVDAALAPPSVCAQVSSSLLVPLQLVRRGHALFASALVTRAASGAALSPRTLRAAWVDPLSVCGHLLPKAWLRGHRIKLDGFFVDERFCGSYTAALRAVHAGEADVCGLHVLPDGVGFADVIAIHLPHLAGDFAVLAVTDAVAGDGIAVGPAGGVFVDAIRRLPPAIVTSIFRADGFCSSAPLAWAGLSSLSSPEFA